MKDLWKEGEGGGGKKEGGRGREGEDNGRG